MILLDFFEGLQNNEIILKNKEQILKCEKLIYKTYHEHVANISADERADVSQDIIVLLLEADREFDPKLGSSFLTFLYWKLKKINHNFCSRYRGVKYTNRARQKDRKDGTLAFINKSEFKGGG